MEGMKIFKMRFIVLVITMGLALALIPQTAMAHTGLTASTPAEGEVITKRLDEIVMEFNTDVESLSSFKLKDEQGNEMLMEESIVQDSMMIGKGLPSMADGKYTVEWKIVGRDGHPIEGNFSFTVQSDKNMAASINPEKQLQTPVDEQQETPMVSAENTPIATPAEEPPLGDGNKSSEKTVNALGLWIIAAIAAGAVIFMAAGVRRKKK